MDCHSDILIDLLADRSEVAPKRRKVFEENPDHFKGNREETEGGLPVRVGDVTIDDAPEIGPLGGGWRGNGPMRISHFMGKDRGYEDGGGLCSPGRWPRSQRNLPDGVNKELLTQARVGLVKSVARTSAGADSPLTLMLKLAAGKFAATPFDPGVVEEMRMKIAKLLGCKEDTLKVDEHQVLRLPLIADLLRTVGDPDWQVFDSRS